MHFKYHCCGCATSCFRLLSSRSLSLLACPGTVTVPTSSTACSASVVYGSPPVADNCGVASVSLSGSNRANGSAFPVGSSNLQFTATDTRGNQATCAYSVIVVDQTPPVLGLFLESATFSPFTSAHNLRHTRTNAHPHLGKVSTTWRT